MILFQHSSPPGITQRTHASTTSIKIQIDQQDPIIHFCSGGSIVTKHKWPSSCLMSMIIIAAICRGFSKHLLWTQHQAEMDSSRRHCLPQTNHHYWHSLYSVFAPLSLAVCPFLIVLILAVPSTTLTPSSFSFSSIFLKFHFHSVASLHFIRLIISHHFILSASVSYWLLTLQAAQSPTLPLSVPPSHTLAHINTHWSFNTARLSAVMCPQRGVLTYSMYVCPP